MTPPVQETEIVKDVVSAASIFSHVRNNRIEYLGLAILLHIVGATNYVFDKAPGVCY